MKDGSKGERSNPSGWNLETLHVHFTELQRQSERYTELDQRRLSELRQADLTALQAALQAANIAGDKAETAQEKRNEGLNELRGVVTDQQATLMPRKEAEALIAAQGQRTADAIEVLSDRLAGGPDRLWNRAVQIATVLAFVVTIIVLVVTHK